MTALVLPKKKNMLFDLMFLVPEITNPPLLIRIRTPAPPCCFVLTSLVGLVLQRSVSPVGQRHLVLLLLLDQCSTVAVHHRQKLARQPVLEHLLALALIARLQNPHNRAAAALALGHGGRHLQDLGSLLGCSQLQNWRSELQGVEDNVVRVRLGAGADLEQGVGDEALGASLLAVFHDRVDELGQDRVGLEGAGLLGRDGDEIGEGLLGDGGIDGGLVGCGGGGGGIDW